MFRTLSSRLRAALALGLTVAFEESTARWTTRLACPALWHAQPGPAASLPPARVPPHRNDAQRPMARSLMGRKCCWRSAPMGMA